MEKAELESLRSKYKAAVEQWISVIRAEEELATRESAMVAAEDWIRANATEEDARKVAKAARQDYSDALREVLFNF